MKFVYWAPRILGVMFVLFLMMFSLDIFGIGLTAWQIMVGLFMHNIPALILTIILIISRKYEMVGGIGFILAGLLVIQSLVVAFPAFVIGILFLIGWFEKNKIKK